ncbi:hypothetical protein BAU07_26095 (plasmid) [Bordetella flabilis]|uniref:Prepilin type IV endopeptidase peptidase domain-containing protein n=2 Tax=Bordetella flabilis TaxID=463014 RepID=A0A193GN57_9BORD|nr:hypothetical protein BAU07_26095 [Bordetella flabilis]
MLWLRVGISSPTAWAYSVFIGALLLLSLIDLDTQLLPSSLVGSVLWAGIFASACEIVPLPVERAIFGAAAGWTLFSIPNWLLAVSRTGDQVAVGEGDVSLIAACGTWLGPQPVIIAGCIAVVGALIVRSIMAMRGSKHEAFVYFPFGPFISFAVIVVMCTNPFHLFVA